MVKIRLRRMGTKGRPFYRVVVAPDKAGRNGRFVEIIGSYDPLTKPKLIKIDEDRALHWLREGAQPSEPTASLLNKVGILEKFLTERPAKRKEFKFLDKTTAATSVASVMDTSGTAAAAEPEAAPAPAPAPEPEPEPEPEVAAEAPAEEPAAEAPAAAEEATEEAAEKAE